jgi:sulfoxide reductase catalytic subunit YedY
MRMPSHRRGFLRVLAAGCAAAAGYAWAGAKLVRAAARKVIPPGTRATQLENENPAKIDAGGLDVTPLTRFGTMGQTMFEVDVAAWRLEITGLVDRPASLDYAQILDRPSFEKKVLLICPGVFSQMGLWKGFSLRKLLDDVGIQPEAKSVDIYSPADMLEKIETFTLDEIRAEKVFLATGVNGQTLPEKHGFPVRVVAEDRYGDDWVKCVIRMDVKG